MTTSGTVHIVDDDEAVRDSLQVLLQANRFTAKTYASAEAFLAAHPSAPEGCAIVDVRMPGMDGIALLNRLRQRGHMIPVIVVTGHGDVPLAVQAMKAGAADFLEKPHSNDEILDLVRRALAAAPGVEAHGESSADVAARIATLTPRERDVMDQLVIGKPNKIIAHELKISPRTVEIHRANLMKKMQADSLSHLVRMALSAAKR
jgi:two-component system, LuxR family, response regulator FixJ